MLSSRVQRSAMAMVVTLVVTAMLHAGAPQTFDSHAALIEALDPRVASVVTGGSWELGNRRGSIRMVVVTQGGDHLLSRLYVQWLEESSDTAPSKVIQTLSPEGIPSGLWTLHQPRLELVGKRWQASIEGTDTHTSPPRRTRWILTFGAPGDVKVQPG